MTHRTQVTFKNMKHSPAIEDMARQHSDKLSKYYDGIQSCRVTIEIPHQKHEKGNVFQVRIDMTVPKAELVVETKATNSPEYEKIEVALNDSFDMAKRRLEDYSRKRRGMVKKHAEHGNKDEEAEIRAIEREQMEEFMR